MWTLFRNRASHKNCRTYHIDKKDLALWLCQVHSWRDGNNSFKMFSCSMKANRIHGYRRRIRNQLLIRRSILVLRGYKYSATPSIRRESERDREAMGCKSNNSRWASTPLYLSSGWKAAVLLSASYSYIWLWSRNFGTYQNEKKEEIPLRSLAKNKSLNISSRVLILWLPGTSKVTNLL